MRVALHVPATSTYDGVAHVLRRAHVHVLAYPDPTALCTGLAAGRLPDAVVTGLRDSHGRSVTPVLRRVRARFPAVPVIVYDVPSPDVARHLLEAARLGVSAAALHGFDDVAVVLRRVVDAAAARHVADAALALAGTRLGRATRPVVGYCLNHAHTVPTVDQVAVALGVSRKTVAARLAAERLPAASTLVSWGRVLHAARWLEDANCPVERVALALGFDSGTGLRHMLARYTGLRATEVRGAGGLAGVLPLFVAALDVGGAGTRAVMRGAVPVALLWAAVTAEWDIAQLVLTAVLIA